jgi:hypothetical protein
MSGPISVCSIRFTPGLVSLRLACG